MNAAEHEAAIAQLLAELGDTADAVADKLRAKGIKGKKGDACACPIANFVDRETRYRCHSVSDLTVVVDDPAEDYMTLQVTNPRAVADFIHRFDSGVYLDLVEAP